MTWAYIEGGAIVHTVEQMTSRDPVWVTEPIYEDVPQEDGSIATVPTDETHIVKASASVPQGWETDPAQMQTWGYVEVVEQNRDEARPQVAGLIEVVNGVPVRLWTTQTDIVASSLTLAVGETVTVTLRLGEDTPQPWPDRVDVVVNGAAGDVAVTVAGNAFLDVEASAPGPIDVTMHGRTIRLEAT